MTPEFLEAAPDYLANLHTKITICLVAIDEAHCISGWGHDFRDSYRSLGAVRRSLPGKIWLIHSGLLTVAFDRYTVCCIDSDSDTCGSQRHCPESPFTSGVQKFYHQLLSCKPCIKLRAQWQQYLAQPADIDATYCKGSRRVNRHYPFLARFISRCRSKWQQQEQQSTSFTRANDCILPNARSC